MNVMKSQDVSAVNHNISSKAIFLKCVNEKQGEIELSILENTCGKEGYRPTPVLELKINNTNYSHC